MSTRRGNVVFMDDLLEEAKAHAAEVVKEIEPTTLTSKFPILPKRSEPQQSDLIS